ncbi:hypothetical protein SB861_66200, partial [Paraburkholderia sp. SIMBA_049]
RSLAPRYGDVSAGEQTRDQFRGNLIVSRGGQFNGVSWRETAAPVEAAFKGFPTARSASP